MCAALPSNDPATSSAENDAQLIDFGYEPVAVDNTKAARGEGWSTRPNTVDAIAAERAACPNARSTGLRTGRTVGLDIDMHNAAHVAEIDKLADRVLGATGLVRFGSKGAMLVYRNETPIRKITVSTAAKEKIEVLGMGQQFVAYGKHPSGVLYRWQTPGIFEPLHTPLEAAPEVTPEKLRDFARQCVELLTRLGYEGAHVTGDMGEKAEPAAPSQAKGKPVSPDELVSVLKFLDPDAERSEWRDTIAAIRATPGIDVEDLRDIAHRFSRGELHGTTPSLYTGDEDVSAVFDSMPPKDCGVAYGSLKAKARAKGWRDDPTPAEVAFAPFIEKLKAAEQETAANDDAPQWPKPTPYGEVIARAAPPVRELIAGLVQRGKANFLSAPGGSHKSRLLQQWGLCLDAGVKVWDRATERAKFVCLSYEDDGDEITRRSRQITHRLQLPTNSTGELWDLQGRDLPLAIVTEEGEAKLTDFGQHVREHLCSIPGHKFVGVDSCYNALRFVGNAKINEGAVMAAIGALDRICKECDCTMMVLWHPSQAGQERGDASGWSVAWHNAPRARLSLSPVKDNDDAYDLKVEKRNYAKAKSTLTIYFSDGVMLPRTSIDERQLAGRLSDACVAAATEAAASGKPIQEQRKVAKVWHDKIAASVGYKPTDRAIKDELDRAIAHGLLVYKRNRNGHGGAAGYYPSPVTGPFVERVRVLARWFADRGVEDVSVSRLHRAHVLLPADPGNVTLGQFEGFAFTDDQKAGLTDFAQQFGQAVDADAFGEAGVRPNKRQAHPEYALRPVLLAAMGTAHREPATVGTVPDKVEGEL